MISSRRHLPEVYQLRSEADEKTLVRLRMPTPQWLDREYPYVPPPDKGGTLRELKFLLSLVPERSENLEFILRADKDFLSLFLELCEEIGTPVIEKDLRDILAESTILILKLKWLYNRPRPYQVARKYGISFTQLPSETANTPAYPGGHTIQAYLVADYLSERAPHHRKLFMDLASQISWSRALGGYHWPSDLIFGKSLYQSIANKNLPAAVRVAAKYQKKREVPRTDGKGTTTIYEYSERQIANRHKEKAQRITEDYTNKVELGRGYWGLDSRLATLSDFEKEDREAERLVQQSPKKKPPRNDLRRNSPRDEEKDPDKDQDKKDRSNNYKDATCSVRVALLWVDAAKKKNVVTVKRKDTGKTVQVSDETLRANPGDYEEVEEGGDAGAKPKKTRQKKPKPGDQPAPPDKSPPEKSPLEKSRQDLLTKYKDLGLDESFISENLKNLTEGSLGDDLKKVEGLLSDAADKSEIMLKMKGGFEALRKRIVNEYVGKGLSNNEIKSTVDLIQSGLQPDELDEIRGILKEKLDIQKKKEDLLNGSIRTPSKLKAFRDDVGKLYSKLGIPRGEIEAATETLTPGGSSKDIKDALRVLDEKAAEVTEKKEKAEEQKLNKKLREKPILNAVSAIPKGGKGKEIEDYLAGLSSEEFSAFEKAFSTEWDQISENDDRLSKSLKGTEKLEESSGSTKGFEDPVKMGRALAALKFKHEIFDDPTYDKKDPLPKKGAKPTPKDLEKSLDRAERSVKKYKEMSKEERDSHLDRIENEIALLKDLPNDNPRKMHLNAIRKGIGVASALTDGMDAKDIGGATARLISAADKGGNLRKILSLGSFGKSPDGDEDARVDQHVKDQELIREIFADVNDEDWEEVLPEDHPGIGFAKLLGSNSSTYMDEEDRKEIRENLADLMLGELQILEPEIDENVDPGSTRGKRETVGKAARPAAAPRNPNPKGIRGWVSNFLKELADTAKSKIQSFMGKAPKAPTPKAPTPKAPKAPRKPKPTPDTPAPARVAFLYLSQESLS